MTSEADSEQDLTRPGTRRSGKRRAHILSAFHDCTISKGFAKTTLRDVAREAEMTDSHVLYYFSGKDTMLEHYFENVAQKFIERIESFGEESIEQQIVLLADLFFAGKGVTRSEIGVMLECFGVAVHDKPLGRHKTNFDRICKTYLKELFVQSGRDTKSAGVYAEISYALLIGLRTAAYFDKRLGLPRARGIFYDEMLNLVGLRQRD
jgi:AcrR family transcriptional regulator